MKRWRNLSTKFLVLILLSGHFVNLAPIADALVTTQESQIETTITEASGISDSTSGEQDSQQQTLTDQVKTTSESETMSQLELTSGEKALDDKITEQAAAPKKTVPVQLLGINDFHGALDTTGTAYLESGAVKGAGKASNLAAHLNEAEAQFKAANSKGSSIRVQAGDMVGASPANSSLLQDEPTIRVLNRMGIEFGTLGNHEFDEGLPEFKRILSGLPPVANQFNEITENYPHEASDMEIVVANVVNKSDNSQPEGFRPYAIKDIVVDGETVKIGFIGVVTTEFPNLVLKKHHENFNVLDEATTIVQYSQELRAQGVNAIVVLGHVAATSSAEVVQGDVARVMSKVNQEDPDNSIDAFFAGHNHQYTNGVIANGESGTRVVQSTSQGKAYIDLQGEIDLETKDFVATPQATVKAVTDRPDKDQLITDIVAEADGLVLQVTEEGIGVAEKAEMISRSYNDELNKESVLGNLITDAQLYMANQEALMVGGQPIKVDFALTNNGGIRADLDVKEDGTITWGAAQKVQPFGNILQVIALKGSDLKGALNEQFNGEGKYALQIAGLSYTYNVIDGRPTSVATVTDNQGQPINDEQVYHVVINDFLFGGGDGFASFTNGQLVSAIDTDTETFIAYFKAMKQGNKKIVAPELGRKKQANATNVVPIQLLGLNDYHGAIDTLGTAYLAGQKYEKVGHAANLATHLNQAQASFKQANANGYTERVQGGDLVGASPASSSLLQDEPTIKIFELMNFGVGTIGNHEFDEGLGEFRRILDGVAPVPGDFNAIVDNYPRIPSTMEVVLANVVNKTDGPQGNKGEVPYGFKPYTVKTYGQGANSVKIGYIGIVTTEFPNLVLKQHHESYDVLDEAATIVKYAKELREDGVNSIVIVSHLAASNQGEEIQGEVVDVMNEVAKRDPDNSVDVVFAGHNHQFTNGLIKGAKNDIRVVQSTSQGKAYIDVQGEIDVATQDFVTAPKAEVKPTTSDVVPDPEIAAIVTDAQERIKEVTEEKVGVADEASTKAGKISRENNEHSESALGNLITDAQLYMANQAELKDENGKIVKADFALTNNGGIRDDLKINPNGEITWGAAQSVQPFGNILQIIAISGKDLKAALNQQHANGKSHYFLQLAGLNMTYTKNGDDFVVKTVTDQEGTAIKDEQSYNIIINDFLFGGGDGFTAFTKGKLVTAMPTDTETFVAYFELMSKENLKITTPQVGRKTVYQTGETELTEATLKAASSVTPIKEGDLQIVGKTLPATKVSYLVNKPTKTKTLRVLSKNALSVVSDEAGNYQFDTRGTNLKKGDEVTITYQKAGISVSETVTVGEKAIITPPTGKLTEKELKAKSSVNEIKAGAKRISGATFAGVTVSYTLNGGAVSNSLVTTTETFAFEQIKDSFKAKDVVIVTFTKDGVTVSEKVIVKEAKEGELPIGGKGSTTIKQFLPQTGEQETAWSMIGLLIMMLSYSHYQKKRKENELSA